MPLTEIGNKKENPFSLCMCVCVCVLEGMGAKEKGAFGDASLKCLEFND